MKLRDLDLGIILNASGLRGFSGEGYWFHKPLQQLKILSFDDTTFVAKTVTLLKNEGNLSLEGDSSPKPWFPNCIKVNPLRDTVLNAVGLSNFGLGYYLGDGQWQERTEPFMISVASTAETFKERKSEYEIMALMIHANLAKFKSKFGIQINVSCKNSKNGHQSLSTSDLIQESCAALDAFSILDLPLMLKFSIANTAFDVMLEIQKHSKCDAICISNTVPFGWRKIDWKKAWGTKKSPLEDLGGGALSGRILAPLVCEYINHLRDNGFNKPINGGGGIFGPKEVHMYHQAGVSSIFIGSVVMLHPWRTQTIVKTANSLVWS